LFRATHQFDADLAAAAPCLFDFRFVGHAHPPVFRFGSRVEASIG
jgi:hypothetical protein